LNVNYFANLEAKCHFLKIGCNESSFPKRMGCQCNLSFFFFFLVLNIYLLSLGLYQLCNSYVFLCQTFTMLRHWFFKSLSLKYFTSNSHLCIYLTIVWSYLNCFDPLIFLMMVSQSFKLGLFLFFFFLLYTLRYFSLMNFFFFFLISSH
jgi:hypothetical protein